MKSLYCLILIAFLLVACSREPSGASVGTAISLTLTARSLSFQSAASTTNTPEPIATNTSRPPITHAPTYTQRPTLVVTHRPTVTSTPTMTNEQKRIEFANLVTEFVPQEVSDIERFNMVRVDNNILEIEVMTIWASQDSQPIVSYDIVQYLAEVFKDSLSHTLAYSVFGGDDYSIHLVTYSTNGDYRYESTTNNNTLMQVANHSISYDEWIAASNAGFR
jgi:hypothetical protein